MENNITKVLSELQRKVKVPKNQRNNFGNYNYRSCEDILEAVKPLLVEHKLVLTISDEIQSVDFNDTLHFVDSTVKITDGKDEVEVSAQAGIDPNRKGMDVAQCFGSSSSYARKYALNGLFLIDDTKDADSTNKHDSKSNAVADDMDWLPDSGGKFDNAKKALKSGKTMQDIRKHYKVSKKVEQLLNI